jgi:hypothetical protein
MNQLPSLYGYCIEASRQTVHHVVDLSEHPHATGSSLDVLAQSAQRDKLATAIRLGTPVNLALVARALQVLVEAGERPERGVAQETFERHPIPRAVRRPYCRRQRRIVPTRPTEQPRGIRDDVVSVRADDQAVELVARHA